MHLITKLITIFKRLLSRLKRIYELVSLYIRLDLFGQMFPIYPSTLNLLVNNICNSKCAMCNIWKLKQKIDYSPDELANILNNKLFKNLKYIGVSGGEPTLRKDLSEIFQVLVNKKPRLLGTGIITNAICSDDVIRKILAVGKICKEASMPFNIMVSLDGVEDIHDINRGSNGNFTSAINVVRYFRDNTDIPVSVACTITKNNVWHVNDVFEYCKSEKVYCRFRIAEYIQRLGNEESTDIIRNFDELESYHLTLFFSKLERTYERAPEIIRTYQNIRKMLQNGGTRSIGCPWQASAVSLSSDGQLFYCSPKSPLLGSCIEQSALDVYRKNITVRKNIIQNSCCDCIHDYHSMERLDEFIANQKEKYWHQKLSLDNALKKASKSSNFSVKNTAKDRTPRQILILGWYGTETAGDKAILGEILFNIRSKNSEAEVILASLFDTFISNWTVKELGYSSTKVINVYSREFIDLTETADEVIMGGGPLMHLEELGVVLHAFMRAKANGHVTHIYGCGIGPLDRGIKYQNAVKQILLLADKIELRDTDSVIMANILSGRTDIANTGDPAVYFVNRWLQQHQLESHKSEYLNLYLRDWPSQYQGQLTNEQYSNIKSTFEHQLGKWIVVICSKLKLRPRLLSMHHYCIGDDDREFNTRFAAEFLQDLNPIIEIKPFTVFQLLESMLQAHLMICMRYHSVLFANTLERHYVAIDYTNGGKICGYLKDQNKLDKLMSISDIAEGKWVQYDLFGASVDNL